MMDKHVVEQKKALAGTGPQFAWWLVLCLVGLAIYVISRLWP